MRHYLLSTAMIVCIASTLSRATTSEQYQRNWPQWRGPNMDGVAPLGRPPQEWSETTNVRWKVAIPGRGSGTPIVWNDRIFLLTAVATDRKGQAAATAAPADAPRPGAGRFGRDRRTSPSTIHQFVVLCLDRPTGKTIWQRTAAEAVPHESLHETNTYASASAVTDGKRLYAFFGSIGVFCYDLDGKLHWQRDLGDMQTRNSFGEGASPALHKDTLVVPFDHEGPSFIEALDATTGKTRWRKERDEPTTWATPLIVEHEGQAQVVTNGTNRVRSYDLATGELLWSCGGQATNPIPTPLHHNGLVYCMTGYRGYAVYAIPLGSKGDITGNQSKLAWSRSDAGPYVSSGVLYKNLLYYTKARDPILLIADPRTGEQLIEPMRLPGLNQMYASLAAAADRIYVTSRDGTTVVLQSGVPVNVLATNKLDEGIDASPAIVGGQMLLRGQKHLYCIEAAP